LRNRFFCIIKFSIYELEGSKKSKEARNSKTLPLQVEMTGSSIFEYVHQADHAEIADQLGLSLTSGSQSSSGMTSPTSLDEPTGTNNPDGTNFWLQ
jgi:hypothetical protein